MQHDELERFVSGAGDAREPDCTLTVTTMDLSRKSLPVSCPAVPVVPTIFFKFAVLVRTWVR